MSCCLFAKPSSMLKALASEFSGKKTGVISGEN
jgi:hypothetical protein